MNAYDDEQQPYEACDHDAERAVLGAMLLDARCIADVTAIAAPDAFHHPAHQMIADAIVAMNTTGRPTDPVSVHDEFLRRGQHTRIGGGGYLHRLYAAAPPIGQAGYYAGIVRRYHQQRLLAVIGTRLAAMGGDPDTDLDDIPDLYTAAIKHLEEGLAETPGTAIPTTGDLFDTTIDRIENPERDTRIPTGIHDLDALLGGWAPGQLVIIAARPSIGKSTLARTAARAAAINHHIPTLLSSMEMPTDEIMRCLISAEARVGLHRINHHALDEDDWGRIARRQGAITEAPLHLDDTPGITLGQLRHNAVTLQRTTGLGLLIIDYLQLMTAPKAENRQQAVAALSRGLKLLAQDLHIPIIALSQLNRESEKRADKKPTSADLRESGAIENDADVIILMHREDAYQQESPRAGECDLIVDKNRSGPKATITVAFQGHYARVADMAHADDWTPHSALRGAA